MESDTKLGHYEISTLLGKGGMGEVWRAKDTKLGREVAIKTLPEEFAKDADRLARFEREAKLLASLNHPNIAAIYGFEEDNGTHFLVLELVEGPTLEDQIKRGAIPVEESLKLALQIAGALEAAHEKGVIHRDLKPANIKVTPVGKVKVLDFGLATAFEGDAADATLSNSPTLSMAATQQGVILGTAAYMSPEQARGEKTDQRVDVWAFGVVLFEMLTGRSTFDGRTVSDVLAAVLAKEPQWESLPRDLHPRLGQLLDRCLAKEPRNRYAAISDVRVDVQTVISDPVGVFVRPVDNGVSKPQSRLPWAVAVLGIIIAGVVGWSLRPPSSNPLPVFFTVETGGGSALEFAVSPDGRHLAYVADNVLWLRSLDEPESRVLEGTEGAISPFWSPDSEQIGFFTLSSLKRIVLDGEQVRTVTQVQSIQAVPTGAWTDSGDILFSSGPFLSRVSALGGTPDQVTSPSGGEVRHYWPKMLPDGERFLYFAESADTDVEGLYAGSFDGGLRQRVHPFNATYVPPDTLVSLQGGTIMAEVFDPDSLVVTGPPRPVIAGSARAVSVSSTGVLAYRGGSSSQPVTELVWLDRAGQRVAVTGDSGDYYIPRLSPDGSRLAVEQHGGQGGGDMQLFDLDEGTRRRLTFEPELHNSGASWHPEGNSLMFHRSGIGAPQMWVQSTEGVASPELVPGTENGLPTDWSPDGEIVLFDTANGPYPMDIWMLSTSDGTIEPVLATEAHEMQGAFSPNGGWFAYTSAEDGPPEVYLAQFPPTGAKLQVSDGGGESPRWRRDGRELFYLGTDGSMMAVDVDPVSGLLAGEPRRLFRSSIVPTSIANTGITIRLNFTNWDVSADGSQFIGVVPVTDASIPPLTVVLNWRAAFQD